jgi:hypothetical protein
VVAMRTGRQVQEEMAHKLSSAERQLGEAGVRLHGLQGRDEAAYAALAGTLAQLGRVRLGELDAGRLTERLDAADQKVKDLIAQRGRAHEELVARITHSNEQQAELLLQRTNRLSERDRCADAHQQQVGATMLRLSADDTFAAQRSHTEYLAGLAEHADQKARQAETDRTTKGAPYEQDKLFSYLWRRRYRYPEYGAWPLIRSLDGWVAGICKYETAHRDYAMLLEIPVRLRAHANATIERAQTASAGLTELEQAAMAADGVPALLEMLEAAQQQLDDASAAIDRAEQDHEAMLQSLAAINAGEDEYTRQALQALTEQLEQADAATLMRDAKGTATHKDDDLVSKILSLRYRRAQIGDEMAAAAKSHEKAQSVLRNMRQLQRQFRNEGFDRSDSMFPSGLGLGDLLSDVLNGALSSGDAWRRMRRHHRWRRRTSTGAEVAVQILGGLLRAGNSGRGRSGGFGGRGGGGGFRSGGSFGGGGGGFRTGGGF